MSLAIGLGGFMDGFSKGQQIRQGWEREERIKAADERSKVLADRQDAEYNRALEQRTAIDNINMDAKTSFDSQVAAGTQKPDNFNSWYHDHTVPLLEKTYLANNDPENAKRVRDWANTHEAQTGARLFQSSILKAESGDGAGAIDDAIKIGKTKGYIDNGYQVLGQEQIVDANGNPKGYRISIKLPDGKEVQQDVASSDLPRLIATFGNPNAAWESQQAARAAADKDAKELKQYEEKKKIDKAYGVGDIKQRGDAITSLRKRFDGGLAGTDKKFDDMSAEEKEKLIDEELALQRGDGQIGLAGSSPRPAPAPARKVLVDKVTGKPVAAAEQAKPAAAQAPGPAATAPSSETRQPIPGVPARAQASVQRRIDELQSKATAPTAPAPDPAQALDQANAALSNGASPDQVATALSEAGVPEWQWPKALQEQLRSRQMAIGLNP